VLDDRLSDRFVCELIWWRLGYRPAPADGGDATEPGSTPEIGAGIWAAIATDPEVERPYDTGIGAGASQGAAATAQSHQPLWLATPETPAAWAERFPQAPELVAERPPNVQLTRSVAAPYKQLLKEQLGFGGYRIGELYPRRTRRAVAVNWLLAHLAERGEPLAESGPLPPLLEPPVDPVVGHPGDRPVA
jgi:hypothetical protein